VTQLSASKDFEPSAFAVSPAGRVEAALTDGLQKATHVSVPRQAAPMLRYAGFEQVGNVRSYLFNRVIIGEKSTEVVVAVEISLFTKHHLRIQDGPALCLHVLLLDIEKAELARAAGANHELTDEDIVAYLASRPLPPQTKGKRDKPPATD